MFAYCNNNPVMYQDPSGHLAITTIVVSCLSAFAVGAGTSAVSQGLQYSWEEISVGQVLVDGALAVVKDSVTGTKSTCYYDYAGRVAQLIEEDSNGNKRVFLYGYDKNGNLCAMWEQIGDEFFFTEYTYDYKNRLAVVKTNDSIKEYQYDAMDRVTEEDAFFGRIRVLKNEYEYLDAVVDGTEVATNQVARKRTTSAHYQSDLTYEYDGNGNIISINDGAIAYEYDSANQLILEYNPYAKRIWRWTYDGAGNITSKTEIDLEKGTDTTYYYTYDQVWGDVLNYYGEDPAPSNDALFSYDNCGNLTNDGTWIYTWQQGRQLATMSNGSTTWTYTYDANGMRIGRTNGTNSYTYIYSNGLLTRMVKNDTMLLFTYDAAGMPLTVSYDGFTYYYVTNLQGDVIAILDSYGNAVAEYTYNAWGELLSATGSMANSLGALNPLLYRGYVYDRETGLYYLQSRYYDPVIGRFINADSQLSTGDFSGLNLFAYCGNNPVNRVDPNGHAWYHWAIGAAIVAGFAIATVVTCGGFAAAATAVGLVSSGVALTSATATAVTAAFIGSATVYGTAALVALGSSSSLQDFADQGNWGTVFATAFAAGLGVWDGYNMYQSQAAQYENAYNYSGGKNESYTQKRGWTDRDIRHAIHNGRQGTTVNRAGEACTAYSYPGVDNQYVVINNSTRSIVQASNLHDPDWIVDGRITWAS